MKLLLEKNLHKNRVSIPTSTICSNLLGTNWMWYPLTTEGVSCMVWPMRSTISEVGGLIHKWLIILILNKTVTRLKWEHWVMISLFQILRILIRTFCDLSKPTTSGRSGKFCDMVSDYNFLLLLLLLLLSRFSHVQPCATPWMAAHQAPLSLGFSRQEHWNGLPFPSPMHESEKWKWSCTVVSNSSRPHGLQPTRLLRPWDFPGKRTGVGCHRLLWQFLKGAK